MAENSGNTLRELFVSIKVAGAKSARRSLKGVKGLFRSLVGDAKIFQANLAAIGVSKAFGLIARGIRAAVTETKRLIATTSELAATQEDAELALESALRQAGDFSERDFQGLKDLASSLQEVSREGDETILGGIALAKSFGATNEQAGQAAEAALNLSAALGKDFSMTMEQVGKTLSGSAGRIGLLVPAIGDLTQEELKAGKAFEIVNKQFGGLAQRNISSFNGVLAQTSNLWGDLLEAAGAPLNEAILPALRQLKSELSGLFPAFRNFGQSMATAFNTVRRIFEALGGTNFLSDIIGKFGRFLADLALLIEDFFFFMRGERSFIGARLGGKSIGEALSESIGESVAAATPAILSGLGQAIKGFAVGLKNVIADALTEPFKDLVKNISDIPILSGFLRSIGNFSSGGNSGLSGVAPNLKTSMGLKNYQPTGFLGSNVKNINNSVVQNNTINTPQAASSLQRELQNTMGQFKHAQGVR